MPKITIDRQTVEVPEGTTILAAAQKMGIEIPALCFREGCTPSTSCLVCAVKLRGLDQFVPSCATAVVDGMEVESQTDEVRQVRRTALELLLSDHTGDCHAPCQFLCPAEMDIPRMLRQIQAGKLADAIVTVKRDIALPAVLGRVCPAPCEKGCRRGAADDPVSICKLKQHVADTDLASAQPYLPTCQADSGKQVAVVGAGPTGLAAAYYLRQLGHGVALFEKSARAGGRLWSEFDRDTLPGKVIEAEVEQILRLGVDVRFDSPVGEKGVVSIARLERQFDAVLIAWGAGQTDEAKRADLTLGKRGIEIDKGTYQTERPSLFAAGGAIRTGGMVVRSVADGKEAAWAINGFLAGQSRPEVRHLFSVRMGRLGPEELLPMLVGASPAAREPAGPEGPSQPWAAAEAARCLHCDCRDRTGCQLRRWAEAYGADPARYRSPRRPFMQLRHPAGIVYESGKCISCGLCVQIASQDKDVLGLTFIGRGFDVRIGVPFDAALADALDKTAAACIEACPTSALAWDKTV
ncbi:MAG: (2Fe-2S)-binding protein [Pirellulales bacterium]|nr:(2Fe-2S)-binding protein [Pirellulales bacterium]